MVMVHLQTIDQSEHENVIVRTTPLTKHELSTFVDSIDNASIKLQIERNCLEELHEENKLLQLELALAHQQLKELKANKHLQPIPVIILTTSSSEKDRNTSYKLGANCFLTKPDSYRQLVDITDAIAKLWFIDTI